VRKLTVSVNISTMMQAEAKAEFVIGHDGTRMRVRLGLPPLDRHLELDLVYIFIFGEGLTFLSCWLRTNPRCDAPLAFLWHLALSLAIELLAC
jgi:hypothetical protein